MNNNVLVCSNTKSLRATLNKLTSEQLLELLKGWLVDEEYEIAKGLTQKRLIIKYLLSHYKNTLSYDQLADLDIFYHQTHTNSRLWHAYKIKLYQDQPVLSPDALISSLNHELNSFFRQHSAVKIQNNAYWIRVCVLEQLMSSDSPPPPPANNLIAVFYPDSQYILITHPRAEYREYLHQSLVSAVGGSSLEDCQLSGKNAESLLDLLLNQKSQGPHKKYKKNIVEGNPLGGKIKKQKTEEKPVTIPEDRDSRDKLANNTTNTFGDEELPILEKVQFKLSGSFKGAPELTVPGKFGCHVTFEGPDVVSGIRELVKAGIAHMPLPNYLADLHSKTTNVLEIEED